MDEHSPDDGALLRATARGDADAFGAFYRRHLSLVVGFLLRQTGSEELAADLAGETFAAALLAVERFDPDRGRAPAWLVGIARNKLHESWRQGKVEDAARRRLGIAPLALTDEDVARVEALSSEGAVLELVEQLGPNERQALLAHVVEEHSYREIAREMQCSEQVVRKRVSRGLAHLRAQIKERP